MTATIIALSIISFLFAVFAFCSGYKLGNEEFFQQCKKHDYVTYTRKNFEEIKNFERVQGYEHGFRDGREYEKRGLKQDDND